MVDITLTRRDALTTLAAGGIAGGSLGVSELAVEAQPEPRSLTDHEIATAEAVATVVYPSAVTVTTEFVATYLRGLGDDRKAALSETVADLNTHTQQRYGEVFHGIQPRAKRDAVLRSLGVNRAQSRPAGTVPERVRYHLVNSLLYALFTTPRGGELVGIENPIGHPGGFLTDSNHDQ